MAKRATKAKSNAKEPAPTIRDRIVDFRRVKASELLPHPENWRIHPDTQTDAMRAILAEVGIADAVLARDTPGGLQLLDGHLRADLDPNTEWPVLVLDVNDDEARKLLVSHDPIASMAEADTEKLEALLNGIEVEDEALQGMLDDLAVDSGIELEPPEELQDPEPELDRAEELREKWGVESGQLWIVAGKQEHRLLCGDATKNDSWNECQLVVTSPPYPGADMWNEASESDKSANVDRIVRLGFDVLEMSTKFADVIAWNVGDCPTGKACMLPTGFNVVQWAQDHNMLCRWAIWDKGIVNPLPPQSFMRRPVVQHITHEWVIVIYPNGWKPREKRCGLSPGTHEWQMRSVWTISPEHASRIGHKAPFPVRLAERCLSLWSLESDLVTDPFIGSGTTMVAAEQLDRRCYGIEISPAYCAVSLERMTQLGCECKLAEQ